MGVGLACKVDFGWVWGGWVGFRWVFRPLAWLVVQMTARKPQPRIPERPRRQDAGNPGPFGATESGNPTPDTKARSDPVDSLGATECFWGPEPGKPPGTGGSGDPRRGSLDEVLQSTRLERSDPSKYIYIYISIYLFCLVSGKQRGPQKAKERKGELILGK